MVNIALGSEPLSICPAADPEHTGTVTIDQIIIAVNNALNGCPLVVTPTPSPTPSPSPGGPTPGGVAPRAAGASVVMGQSLRALGEIMTAIGQIARGGGRAAGGDDGAGAAIDETTTSCSGGGSRDVSCAATPPGITYTITFSDCRLTTTGGGTLEVDGTITAHAAATSCGLIPPTTFDPVTITNLQITARNGSGTTTLSAVMNLSGSVSASIDVLATCKVQSLDMRLTGTASVTSAGETTQMQVQNTHIVIGVTTFSSDCVPLVYSMTINGQIGFDGPETGDEFTARYTDFMFGDNSQSGDDLITLDGLVESSCFGSQVTFDTTTALDFPPATVCPRAGVVTITPASGGSSQITFTATGGVNIGGTPYLTCVDPALRVCPAG